MSSPRQIIIRGILGGLLATLVGTGACFAYVDWYSRSDRILPGVHVALIPVGGLTLAEAAQSVSQSVAGQPLLPVGALAASFGTKPGESSGLPSRLVLYQEGTHVRWQEQGWFFPSEAVGPKPDIEGAVQAAKAVGRSGSLWQRTRSFVIGQIHGHYLTLLAKVDEQAITERLQSIAAEIERAPVDASYQLETDRFTDEANGQQVDLNQSLAAIRQAILTGQSEVELVVQTIPPSIHREELGQIRRHPIGTFRTPILATDQGRVHNIELAIRKISGMLLPSGALFSFNDRVGPRDEKHGWAQAKELYEGEFVVGYGGGICQVSSTLYNAVLLAGLKIEQRFHHDRPLQYIDPGRDATVAYQLLDFRFRNNGPEPLVIEAEIIKGSPSQIEVTLYAAGTKPAGSIRLEDHVLSYSPPALEEIYDFTLPVGVRKVVDEGVYGIEVQLYRVFTENGRERRELVSHDHYQPKSGKVRIGVDRTPGSQRLLDPQRY